MTSLQKHVEVSIRERCFVPRGERILVAVSGGLDSMVLLHLLHQLAQEQRGRLSVAHLNHRLRGSSSEADQRLVMRTAEQLGLPVLVERADVRAFAKAQKLSLEMAARRVRHQFLARCAQRVEARFVALAHHADDQVELFFVRLFRGAGSEGVSGMKWRSPSPANPKVAIVRPLLDLPRATLQQYAADQKLRFREDASNASLDIQRNRIRHELLPLLERNYQPGLRQTVLRLMDIAGAESAVVRETAEQWLQQARRRRFEGLPLAVQRIGLRLQLLERLIVPDFEMVERLRIVPDQWLSVDAGRSVLRDAAGRIHLRVAKSPGFKTAFTKLELNGRTGACEFGRLRIEWRLSRQRGDLHARVAGCEYFDADKVGSPIMLRHWQPGDRFQPIGMRQPVKLQDVLTNARIPREQRRDLVVAASADGKLFWVEGLRIGEPFKLTARTNRRLQWRWQTL